MNNAYDENELPIMHLTPEDPDWNLALIIINRRIRLRRPSANNLDMHLE